MMRCAPYKLLGNTESSAGDIPGRLSVLKGAMMVYTLATSGD